MATLQIPSNVKCITSGQVPTTTNLKDGEFAFGKVGGVAKLYGNVNGVIIDFTGDSGTIDADTLNGLLSGGNGIEIAKNTAGDKVQVKLSNNITLGAVTPLQGHTGSLNIKTFGGSKPVIITLNDNGISTLFGTPDGNTDTSINIVEDGIKYVDSSGTSEVTYNYLREGNVKTVNGQSIYGSGDIKSYPVGSIYLSASSATPGSLFGGTWEQIKDVFLLAAGNTYHAGLTGGEATHTLTVEEMPAHAHDVELGINWSSGNFQHLVQYSNEGSPKGRALATTDTGGGKSHNNMPPYRAVYMWRRLA